MIFNKAKVLIHSGLLLTYKLSAAVVAFYLIANYSFYYKLTPFDEGSIRFGILDFSTIYYLWLILFLLPVYLLHLGLSFWLSKQKYFSVVRSNWVWLTPTYLTLVLVFIPDVGDVVASYFIYLID